MIEHRDKHRRHAGERGDLLLHQILDHRVDIEADVLIEFGADAHAEQHVDGQCVDVERRQHPEQTLIAFVQRRRIGPCRLDALIGCRCQIAMGQHRALRQAGGAAGILQQRDRIGQIGDRIAAVDAVVIEQRLEGQMLVVIRDAGELLGCLHLRVDCLRISGHFRDVADDQLLQTRVAQHRRHLRI